MTALARRVTGQGLARARLVALAVFALSLAGCASIEPVAVKPIAEAAPVPAAAPKTTGVDSPAVREHKQLLKMFGGEYRAATTEKLLDEVLGKLAAASDTPGLAYKVTVLNSPIVNAFALPSGRLYVTRGLLALANDTAEVAAVMAHEIAHVTARHAFQREEVEKRSALISNATAVLDDRSKSRSFQAYAQSTLASFSRQQEIEADQIGVRTIARAGYDPYAASRFLQALGHYSAARQSIFGQDGNGGAAPRPDMTSTHPSTPERIDRAVAEARQIGAPGIGEVGRDRYLAAIDGMAYGDDPAEGFVRGTRFVHPKLGFAFTAPDGFVLENSAQAVLGIADGGQQALRLDRVHVAPDMSLDAYLGSGWIDGLEQGSVENIVVGGFPTATATAKGSEWFFRLAAIRQGDEVYRLIFATKSFSGDVDARFRAAIDSFRKITPEEARDAKPLRIAIATAGGSDTPEGMASRMRTVDNSTSAFLVLNGLDGGEALKTGERYKLVTD